MKLEVIHMDDYWVCPDCGAYLDIDEPCDCWKPLATELTIDPRIIKFLQLWREEVRQRDRQVS